MDEKENQKQCLGCFAWYGESYHVCPHCGYVEGTPVEEPLHMMPGTRLRDRYIIGKVLGFGGFGVTYIGWDTLLSVKVAVKEYLPSEFSTRMVGQNAVSVYNGNKAEQFAQGLERFVDEAKRLAKFNHESGIVRIYDSFLENNTAYIVMEYLDGETLAAKIEREGRLPAEEVLELLMPVIHSLETVHQNGIVHRDIAPDNIMVTTEGEAKLIDFGAARYATTTHSRSLTVIIKEGFSPEEQYRSRGEQGPYTDVYAVAATMYKAITGITPPDALERRVYCENKKKDPLKELSDFETGLTPAQQIAIMNALNVQIEDRTPDMKTFAEELTGQKKPERRQGQIKRIDFLKWPLWAKIGVPVAACGAITLGVLAAVFHVQYETADIPEEMVRVPSVINAQLEQSSRKLDDSILLSRVIGAKSSTLVPEHIVMHQNKSSGSYVMRNTIVGMQISTGVENNQMPDVMGMYEDSAVTELEQAGYSVNLEEAYSDVIAEGAVIDQDIAPKEEYDLGEIVTLTISQGADPEKAPESKMIETPDLSNRSYSDVLKLAQECGMQVAVLSREYSDTVPEGAVFYQSLLPKQKVMNQNTIELMVSKGKQTIRVENVFCQSEEDAKETLYDQGLTVSDVQYEYSDIYEEGLVIAQSPDPGEEVALNEPVILTVSSGCAAFQMPDVSGMALEDARQKLLDLGLVVTAGYEIQGGTEAGTILEQSIAAEEAAMPGDVVILTVCADKNADIAEVPDVVGMTEKKASRALGKKDLRVAVSEAYSDEAEAGSVISQMPPAGVSVISSGVVTITVSKGSARVSVPDVVNRSQDSASSMLKDAGLSVKVETEYSDTVVRGMVISQSPGAEESAKQGDTVKLKVSKGREPVTIPDVSGMTKEEAVKKLEEMHLKYVVQTSYSDTVEKGKVISQIPDAGQKKLSGDKVVLLVSIGKASVMPAEVKLNESAHTLTVGESFQLTAKIMPENASDKMVAWTSDHDAIASVSENGLVKAVAEGTAVITVKTNSGGKTATCKVTVKKPELDSVSIVSYPSRLTYHVGDSLDTSGLRLMATYNNRLTEVISSGFQVSCDLSRAGEQEVRITYEGSTVSYTVTVLGNDISLNERAVNLAVGETYRLSVSNGTGGTISWSSSNNNVASVSDGVIVGHNAGTAVITVIASADGRTYRAQCSVHVAENIQPSMSVLGVGHTLSIGESASLFYESVPSGQPITWSSSNPGCVSVSNGVVTAHAGGSAEIRATMSYHGGTYSASCVVEVAAPSIRLSSSSISLYTGQLVGLSASTTPGNLSVSWNSSNPGVAIYSGGLVHGLSAGQAVLTASITDRNGKAYTASCTVSVNTVSLSINASSLNLYIGDSGQLSLGGVPSGAQVTWESNSGAVSVDQSGRYKAIDGGSAALTATVEYGDSYTISCNVAVKEPYIQIMNPPASVTVGSVGYLTANYDSGGQVISWSSSNPECMVVEDDGSYCAVGTGTTIINAYFVMNGQNYIASTEITIVE